MRYSRFILQRLVCCCWARSPDRGSARLAAAITSCSSSSSSNRQPLARVSPAVDHDFDYKTAAEAVHRDVLVSGGPNPSAYLPAAAETNSSSNGGSSKCADVVECLVGLPVTE